MAWDFSTEPAFEEKLAWVRDLLRAEIYPLETLEIDESRLPEPPRYEPGHPADPDSPLFPHIYGPIPVAAVVRGHEFPPGPDGTFTVPEQVARPDPVPQPGDG